MDEIYQGNEPQEVCDGDYEGVDWFDCSICDMPNCEFRKGGGNGCRNITFFVIGLLIGLLVLLLMAIS